ASIGKRGSLLRLVIQNGFQCFELLLPVARELPDPRLDIEKRTRIEMVVALTAARLLANQARPTQDLEVFRNRGTTNFESTGQIARSSGAVLEPRQKLPPNRVRDGGE